MRYFDKGNLLVLTTADLHQPLEQQRRIKQCILMPPHDSTVMYRDPPGMYALQTM